MKNGKPIKRMNNVQGLEKAVGIVIGKGSSVTLLGKDEEVDDLTKTLQYLAENPELNWVKYKLNFKRFFCDILW